MRRVQTPPVNGPAARARSKTLTPEMLEARVTPNGSIKERSTSLCPPAGVSGHQRAPSRNWDPAVMLNGILTVPPGAMEVLPTQTQPSVGNRRTPAPLTLLN